MKHDKQNEPGSRQNDDVGRLFDKLGSGGAGLYQDFEPGRLPAGRSSAGSTAPQASMAPPAAAPVAAPPPLAAVRSLRPEVAAVAAPVEGAASEPGAAATPLAELFQRLLQADTAAPSSGVLKRMFAR